MILIAAGGSSGNLSLKASAIKRLSYVLGRFRYNGCIRVYLPECIGVNMGEPVRWNIKVSRETDFTLRTFLGAQGIKKGDLSKFIEEAVRWRVFHRTVQDIKERNANADPNELQALIDDAVREVRAERRVKRKADKA